MHTQTLSWARLSKSARDAKLIELGLKPEQLEHVRSKEPRERVVEAAKLAIGVDDEPNSDLIEYIAGYGARAGLYHHFRSVKELLGIVQEWRVHSALPKVVNDPSRIDVSAAIPPSIGDYPVHVDGRNGAERLIVWQKVNGGMRSVLINRVVPRTSFLSGILLYAGEGTKSIASSKVEIANSSPNILRIFIQFLEDIGVPKKRLRARVQIHRPEENSQARQYWVNELGLAPNQFTNSMVSSSKKEVRRHTYTLQLSYPNSMLFMLLRAWTIDLESMVRLLDCTR